MGGEEPKIVSELGAEGLVLSAWLARRPAGWAWLIV